jgi:lipopolysaccharide transport system ATP-binding protein
MKDVSEKEGRTVLFVSHNMAAISNLCSNSIFLQNGKVINIGMTSKIIEEYITHGKQSKAEVTQYEISYDAECKDAYFDAIRI